MKRFTIKLLSVILAIFLLFPAFAACDNKSAFSVNTGGITKPENTAKATENTENTTLGTTDGTTNNFTSDTNGTTNSTETADSSADATEDSTSAESSSEAEENTPDSSDDTSSDTSDGNSEETSEEILPDNSFVLDGTNLRDYFLIIPDTLTQFETAALTLLQETVAEKTGVSLRAFPSTTNAEHEIRFGATGKNSFTLSELQYRIEASGGHLNLNFKPASALATVKTLLSDWFSTSAASHTTANKTYTITEAALGTNGTAIAQSKNLIANGSTAAKEFIAITDQLNGQISVLHYNTDAMNEYMANSSKYSWRWLPKEANNYKVLSGFSSITEPMSRVAEVRLRYDSINDRFLLLSVTSSGAVYVSTYNDGKCVWEAAPSGEYNPHSIELLPNGFIAVANGGKSGESGLTGGFVRIYNINTNEYVDYELYGAHDVLWDPQMECLWALGTRSLQALTVGQNGSTPTVSLAPFGNHFNIFASGGIRADNGGGHAFSFIPGEPSKMFVVCSKTIFIFDKTAKSNSENAFTPIITGGTAFKSAELTKSGGTLLVTHADNDATLGYPKHDTNKILMYQLQSGTWTKTATKTFTGRGFYKVRIFHWRYFR